MTVPRSCTLAPVPAEMMRKTACAEIVGVNRNMVNSWYNDFRHKIMLQVLAETRTESGEFEVDESYFGAHRVRGKRGRGAAGKTPVFGLLKRGGKVIVRIVPVCSKGKAYDGLILNGYDHYRVFHSENEFARGKYHVNGIENVQTLCVELR